MTTIPPNDTRTRWYYADANNQPVGPVTGETLQSLCQNGTITLDTFVVPEEGGDWKAYSSISVSGKPPVPIPPARPQQITQAPKTQKCPFCAELVSTEAKKCKHCGETLDVALRAAEEAKRAQTNQPMVFMNAAGGGAVSNEKHKFPHLFHCILTLFTGVWGVIWILHYAFRDKSYYR